MLNIKEYTKGGGHIQPNISFLIVTSSDIKYPMMASTVPIAIDAVEWRYAAKNRFIEPSLMFRFSIIG